VSKFKGLFLNPKEENYDSKQTLPIALPTLQPPKKGYVRVSSYLNVSKLVGFDGRGDGDIFLKMCLQIQKPGKKKKPKVVGLEISLPNRPRNCKGADWNATRFIYIDIPQKYMKLSKEHLTILFELWEKTSKTLRCLASATVPHSKIVSKELDKPSRVLQVPMKVEAPVLPAGLASSGLMLKAGLTPSGLMLKPEGNSEGGRVESKDIRLIIRGVPAPHKRKYLFFVRHGESRWNHASANRDIVGLVKEVDHSLSTEGKHQCLDLQDKIYAGEKKLREKKSQPDTNVRALGPFEEEFFRVKRIFSSPLSRAVQTSLIGLAYHPLFQGGLSVPISPGGSQKPIPQEEKIQLIACARERRNFGSFDTQAKSVGREIIERAESELKILFGNQGLPKPVKSMIKRIDIHDCTYPWWNTAKESSQAFSQRMREFSQKIAFDPHQLIVVVGHSHFIRDFVKSHLSEQCAKNNPKLASDLSIHVVENCGVLGLDLNFSEDGVPVIQDLQLMFGSKIKIKQHLLPENQRKNLLDGVWSSVQGFVKRQQESLSRRKSQRQRAAEGSWWFTCLQEVMPAATEEDYRYTTVRSEIIEWNRQLLNMHLGNRYFAMIKKINPVCMKEWYYLLTDIAAEEATEEELDIVLTPWSIDAMYEDLLSFGMIRSSRRRSYRPRSRSRSRGREETAPQRESSGPRVSATASIANAASSLGIPHIFGLGSKQPESPKKRFTSVDSVGKAVAGAVADSAKISHTCHILKVACPNTKGHELEAKALSGVYHYSSPGVWRHVERHMLCIYLNFSSSTRGRKKSKRGSSHHLDFHAYQISRKFTKRGRREDIPFTVQIGEMDSPPLAVGSKEIAGLSAFDWEALNGYTFDHVVDVKAQAERAEQNDEKKPKEKMPECGMSLVIEILVNSFPPPDFGSEERSAANEMKKRNTTPPAPDSPPLPREPRLEQELKREPNRGSENASQLVDVEYENNAAEKPTQFLKQPSVDILGLSRDT